MFRMWCKLYQNNRMLKDITIEDDDYEKNRTKKVFDSLDACCQAFNLSVPIWLDSTIRDFKLYSKARFTQDAFIDSIDFDYLEIHVIEEDY